MDHPPLIETHRTGNRTREWIVRAAECQALMPHHIAHVGVADAAAPYTMVRADLPGSYFLASCSGEGCIYLDGRWKPCGAAMACLAPAHVLHAFHCVPGQRWTFAWVRYDPEAGSGPLGAAGAPVLAKFLGEPLRAAILGLYHEQHAEAKPAALHHWVELIRHYVLRFAQPWQVNDRLPKIWDAVAAEPGRDWTLAELSRMAHCSGEHLRRLCRGELGRSPMEQVTYLRIRHAANLLTETHLKLDHIADAVGYSNPFVFSNAFKKWTGWRPSDYRARITVSERQPPAGSGRG